MSVTARLPTDTVGAFVGRPAVLAAGAPAGPLAGRSLAVKDLVDVAGTVTGAGNPDFAAGRAPAERHAPVVERLVAAGATVVGKTVTDELAYSLSGTNVHHGTPVNVAAPGRVPGGSSAGSAAAVAAGLVDLAVATDTGGSIRVPASYCGLVGWRPTHGAVPLAGVVPLAPSYDTVGLLARDPAMLAAGAAVLLDDPGDGAAAVAGLWLVDEALAVVEPAVAAVVARAAGELAHALGVPLRTGPLGVDLDAGREAFRVLQAREAWAAHGHWITATRPALGPGIGARFAAASEVTDAQIAAAAPVAAGLRDAVRAATADGTALVLPSAAGPAPPPGLDHDAHTALRLAILRLTSPAGLAGAPAVSLPLAAVDGLPVGVGLVGHPGADRALLRAAAAS